MRRFGPTLLIISAVVLLMAAVVYARSNGSVADIPLKEAKLNIEHNATDRCFRSRAMGRWPSWA
jgi:hypothetical protein